MSDLIEREKAIDAIKGEIEINGYSHVVNVLEQLPSAQPETHEERTETHACDLISRKAAIDALDKIFPADPMRNDYTQGITCGAALATEYIKQLPSAQPTYTDEQIQKMQDLEQVQIQTAYEIGKAERKTGRWIPQDHNKRHGNISTCVYYSPVCSECGHTGDFNMNYCPNCGARMKGSD